MRIRPQPIEEVPSYRPDLGRRSLVGDDEGRHMVRCLQQLGDDVGILIDPPLGREQAQRAADLSLRVAHGCPLCAGLTSASRTADPRRQGTDTPLWLSWLSPKVDRGSLAWSKVACVDISRRSATSFQPAVALRCIHGRRWSGANSRVRGGTTAHPDDTASRSSSTYGGRRSSADSGGSKSRRMEGGALGGPQ